jgi:hypothetical protein
MSSTTTAPTGQPPALSYDEILDGGVLVEETVPLCLNGRIRRQYEDVKQRVEDRTADYLAEREAAKLVLKARRHAQARVAGAEGGDDRLVSKPAPEPEPEDDDAEAPYVDEEQGELDRLRAEMLRWTVPFVVRAIPDEEWNELLEAHPPRRDPANAKAVDARDAEEGVNTATFYRALVRRSIAEPEHDDVKFARLMKKITVAQFERIKRAAARVNLRDEDLPFSPGDLESRRH